MTEPPLTSRLPAYEALIANQILPLARRRVFLAAAEHARRAELHGRAEAVQALLSAPQPSAFRAPVGAGVLLHAEADLRSGVPLLVDVGAGLHLEMAPMEALAWLRRGAAEAQSDAALADKATRATMADLNQACDAVATLKRLAEGGAE